MLASLQANVDRYGGFHKCGYPKMDGLQWKTILKYIKLDDLGGTSILGNLYIYIQGYTWNMCDRDEDPGSGLMEMKT